MASSSPPLQKKQQSISKFFSKNPAATTPPRLERKDSSFVGKENSGSEPSLFVEQDETTAPTVNVVARPRPGDVSVASRSGSRKRKSVVDTDDDEEESTQNEPRSGLLDVEPHQKRRRSGPAEVDRTSRFLFSSSPVVSAADPRTVLDDNVDDEEHRKLRQHLHQKFVKKLGRPESLAELRRRNRVLGDDTHDAEADEGDEGDEEEQEHDASTHGRGRGKPTATNSRKSKDKLTPLQRQVIDLKRKHPDAILVVEAGYKYKIFGEDARIAARELAIVCIPGKMRFDEHPSEAHLDKFASASFPTHRLHVHVKRLVSAGHKVGIVRQLETAALKAAGTNRNKIFERGLTNLYTKGTYIDDEEGLGIPLSGSSGGAPATGHLLCLTESYPKGVGSDEKVQIGLVAVQPSTGDIIYDDFEDGWMRGELETRLLHISPCEFLIVGEVSKATEKLVVHLSGGDDARLERVDKPKTMAAQAYSHITKFYADKLHADHSKPTSSQVEVSQESGTLLDKAHRLSENATICLSAMITHLTDYGLQHVFDLTKCFQSFSARAHMLLNGNTLTSLEIYRNQTDQTEQGSLFWTLNRTRTRFGQRMLRKWVGRPLLDRAQLDDRVAAIEELKDDAGSSGVERIKNLLTNVRGDLEKTLIRIYYKKCTRSELLGLLQTLQLLAQEYAHVTDPASTGFRSQLLAQAIISLPRIADDVVKYLDRINAQAAKADDKYNFFRDEFETEAIVDHKVGIVAVEHDLEEFKKVAAEKVKRKKVEYVTVAEIEYLIELDNANLKNVPASWIKISGTKKVSRYHAPEVVKLIRERDQHKEALSNACESAFMNLLSEIGGQYQAFRDCIQSLALLDCLLSLAQVASQPGYCKPTFTDEPGISIQAGRHPMVEQLLLDPFVPNDIELSSSATRALLITGPNMGGKSSYVRSVALIAIMAQIGSYVPAMSARLGLLDAVFTRMGAFDNMLKGESTFMVELGETSDLLKQASPRSLVILDELGRGTSTHDGVAIAHAVLDHLVQVPRCLTLFITHYQTLARLAERFATSALKNVHMRFVSHRAAAPQTPSADTNQDAPDRDDSVTFLYQVGDGVAHRSYGLNVARLAGLPKSLLDEAARRSRLMELEEGRRRLKSLARAAQAFVSEGVRGVDAASAGAHEASLARLVEGIEQL